MTNVFLEIFNNIPILQLYGKEEAYLWTHKKEILEACDIIYSKDMFNSCPLLDNFIEFGRKKEEKKESKHILRLLENRSIDQTNEVDSAQYNSVPSSSRPIQKEGLDIN